MNDDAFKDIYDSAISRGVENAQILLAAAAWCQNVGQTTEGLGIGTLEAMTGLPITGGSLRCEHAKAPTSYGVALAHSAVEFYEKNCIGCPHRKPTEATEHLGTWADEIIAKRKERERQVEEARLEAEEARRLRREDRRLRFGNPDPTGQSILDLIDLVDGKPQDPEAEDLLLRHAELSPGDFSDELLAHLTSEAVAIGNDALLEAVVAVFERDGRPGTARILDVAFGALTAGVAGAACGRVIAAHAQKFDVDDQTLAAITVLAAGRVEYSLASDQGGAEPAALLRLYDVEPDQVTEFLGARLNHDDVWMRSAAAHAAGRLVAARPDAGARLLPALLDAVSIPDRSQYQGDPFASGQTRNVVADILIADPVPTAAAIDERMRAADDRSRRKLWSCFDHGARSRLQEPLPLAVCEVIGKRAAALLAQEELDVDLRREVADTLSLLCRYHRDGVTVSIKEIIALLVASGDRYERFNDRPPDPATATSQEQALLAYLGRESASISLNSVVTELNEALKASAERAPTVFVETLLAGMWAAAEASPLGRASLLKVLGAVIREQADLDLAAPILLATIESERNRERAAAYEALAEIGRREVTLPAGFAESALKALRDQYLIIVLAAIRALPMITVPEEQTADTVIHLLQFAATYGPGRLHTEYVRIALRTSLSLAAGQPFQPRVEELVLDVAGGFPSTEAVEILDRLPIDHNHPSWPKAVVSALQPDPDPNWAGIRDRRRAALLRDLATIRTDHVAPFFDTLEEIAVQRLPYDSSWAWAVSDTLARHGEHRRAAAVCDAVVDAMPDTTELRARRSFASQVALGHHLDVAAIAGDSATTQRLLVEWATLAHEGSD